MLRTVYLHGRLGKKFGRKFELQVDSAAEAARALAFQLPGFMEHIRDKRYTVTVGRGRGVVLPEDALPLRLGAGRSIHFTPAGATAGLETVLLAVTLALAVASAVAVLSMPTAPSASGREEATKTSSYMFDGAQNVTEQGHPVPLVYGRFRVGSVVGSAGISTTDVNEAGVSANPTNPYGGGTYPWFVGTLPGITGSPQGNEWTRTLAKGGKGGSGTARAAQEDPNTLQSQATAKVLDIVSEGEIVGLVDGLKSVYFDETPLQNADGSFNFAGVAVEQRVGLPDQDFVPGFTQAENSREINAEVTTLLGPVTRSINDETVTVARVTIRLPQLYQQDTTNGDLKATTVSVKISVQADGGGFTDVTTMVFTGKTNSGYQRSVDIRLPTGVLRDIRVTRLTADAAVASLSNETFWDLLTEVVEAKLSYPDTALIGLTVDARQFGSNIPTRSYDLKGLIVEVPSNYNAETRVYTGIWDGTFIRAWTDNPSWVLRDITLNKRYGLGNRVLESAPDKWALYAMAQHNDELVPDGFGGMTPRYTINCCINNPAQAYEVLASIASNCRAQVYWGNGAIIPVQDRAEDPSFLITPSNVVGGDISYGRITPAERRRSVAVVYWNDPEDGYRLTPEIHEDPELVRRFGRRGDSGDQAVTAFGVTTRGHANRMCRWILEDESPGSNATASYQAGDDHGFVSPGSVGVLADPMFTESRRGGRVRSATVDQVEIDAPVTIVGGQTFLLRVMLPDGSAVAREVTNAPGAATVLTLDGPDYAVPPVPGAVWAIETDVVANRQWRVRQMTTDETPFEVRAVLHDPTKYDRVELDRDISTPNFLGLPSGPLLEPEAIEAFEFLFEDGNAAIPCVQVSWQPSADSRVTFYQAQYKPPGGNWEAFADSIDVARVVRGIAAGTWSFRVRALDSLGRKTGWVEREIELDGQIDNLPAVTGLSVLTDSAALQSMIIWVNPVDHRPLRYEILFDDDGVFANAISLAIVDTQEYIVAQPGTYWVRTLFLNAALASPPSIDVGLDDLPILLYENVVDAPHSLAELDIDAAQDIIDLFTTYGSTASAAASASAAAASAVQAAIDRATAEAAATNAAADEALAEAHKNAAGASATSASGSAGTATGQAAIATAAASAAAISSSVTATYLATARTTVTASLPYDFGSDGAFWTNVYNSDPEPSSLPAFWTFPTVTGIGKVAQFVADGAFTQYDIGTRGRILAVAGRRYTFKSRFRCSVNAASGAPTATLFAIYTSATHVYVSNTNVPFAALDTGDGWQSLEVPVTGDTVLGTGAVYVHGMMRIDTPGATGTFQIQYIKSEDTTESNAAANSASASSSSAAAASASASTATTQAALSASFAANAQQTAMRLFPDRPAVGEDFTLDYTLPPTSATALTGGSVVSVAGEGNVRQYVGLTGGALQRSWMPISPGATYRTAARLRCTVNPVSGNNHHMGIGFFAYNAAGTLLGEIGWSVLTLMNVAQGWLNPSLERTYAQIIAAHPTATYIRSIIDSGRNASFANNGATWQLATFSLRDVTSEANAAASASVATAQQVLATAAAASASASLVLTASLSYNALTSNSGFDNWPGGSGTIPEGWSNAGNGTVNTREAGDIGGYAFQQVCAGGNVTYGVSQPPPGLIGRSSGYFVVEGEVTLVSGSLRGTVLYLGKTDYVDFIDFFTAKEITTQTVVGAGVAGKRYKFARLMAVTGTATDWNFHALSKWGGITTAAGTIKWHSAYVREASEAEIRDQTVLLPMQATVSTHSSAIATLNGAVAIHETLVAASGSFPAIVRLKAGVGGSNIALAAEALYLLNYVNGVLVPALTVEGGNAVLAGGLKVGAFIKLGSGTGWPVALKAQDFAVSDGTVVSFGTDLGALPSVDFPNDGLAPLASGETYASYADGLSATGFTARLKISTPGTVTNYDLTVDTTPGSGPTRQIDKAANPDSNSGNYTFEWTGSWAIDNIPDAEPGIWYPGEGTFSTKLWVKKSGVWQEVTTVTTTIYGDGIGSGHGGSYSDSRTVNCGTGVEAFGISAGSNTGDTSGHSVTDFTHAKWATTAVSGTRTATPSGQIGRATVRPS